MDKAFNLHEVKHRLLVLASQVCDRFDCVLCTSPENIYYLSGFRTTLYTRFTALLVQIARPTEPILIVSAIDRHLIEDQVWSPPLIGTVLYHGPDSHADVAPSPSICLKRYLAGAKRLGVDSPRLSEIDEIKRAAPSIEIENIIDRIHEIRRIKSAQEIEYLRQANRLAISGIEQVRRIIDYDQITELEIAIRLDTEVRQTGSDGFGYPTLVSCGRKISAVHSPPLPQAIEPGQPVRIAFGPMVQGYPADVVRTLCSGHAPSELVRLQDGFLIAQQALINMIRPGISALAMFAKVEEIYAQRGLRNLWNNTIGHSVGLTVHEPPRIIAGSEEILEAGMVLAIEPGLIASGFGGFWQCDVMVVKENGSELLTSRL
jgi:Xaa-Pro aminopeptidase